MRIVLLMLASLMLAGPALATPQKKLTSLLQEVDRLEAADENQTARTDLNTLRAELGAAQAHLNKGHKASARLIFERARVRARLVSAKLARAHAEVEARVAQQTAAAQAERAEKLRTEAFTLEQALVGLEQAAKKAQP